MNIRSDLAECRAWVREGDAFVLAAVDRISDDDLRAPSALPGWTRSHVVGHLARNAEAIIRLATWARTGVEHPMYPSVEARDADIEDSAAFPTAALRAELVSSAADVSAAFEAMDDDAWAAPVHRLGGRDVAAAELPFWRAREVWLHAVDLGVGVGVDELPHGFVDALLDDATAAITAKDGCPSLVLAPTDRQRAWVIGDPGPAPAPVASAPGESIPAASAAWVEAPTFTAPAATLAGWLTGRVPASEIPGTPPELPHWM